MNKKVMVSNKVTLIDIIMFSTYNVPVCICMYVYVYMCMCVHVFMCLCVHRAGTRDEIQSLYILGEHSSTELHSQARVISLKIFSYEGSDGTHL